MADSEESSCVLKKINALNCGTLSPASRCWRILLRMKRMSNGT